MRSSRTAIIVICNCLCLVNLQWLYGEVKAATGNINTQFTIRDSLSQAAIPVVRVSIENLKQSFITRKSAFYLPLSAGTYRFMLESDGYETLTSTVDVSAQNLAFTLEMVSTADRMKIKENDSVFHCYLGVVKNALQNYDFVQADLNLDSLKPYAQLRNAALDSVREMYVNARKNWADSLFRLAQENENSKKYPDALYYYHHLYAYDSLLTEARAGIGRVDSLLAMADKKNLPKEVKKLTPDEIEKLFQEGRAKFVADDYAGAKKIFLRVLANNPGHEKAKDYLRRTEARLKALGE
jgi:hypothetical protein